MKQTEIGCTSQQPTHKLNVVLVAYLAHLVVPLFLAFDVIAAWLLGYVEYQLWQSPTIVLGISMLWLTVGLGAFLLSRDRKQFVQRAQRPLISVYSIYLTLIVLELVAHLAIGPSPRSPALWPPGRKWLTKIDSNLYPGIHGVKAFTVNKLGLRGPDLPDSRNFYEIVTVGGSTTECAALDDTEEWPHLLMQEMNAQQKKYPVWVANAGVSGDTTVHHLALIQTLPIIRKVDMLIFLIGVNDLGTTLAFQGAPSQTYLQKDAAFLRQSILAGAEPTSRYPLYKRLRLFRLNRNVAIQLREKFLGKEELIDLNSLRNQRAAAPIVPLPDLQIGLEEYRVRVLRLAAQCRVLGVRCLFLTQPSIWRSDLSAVAQRILDQGWVGPLRKPKGYLSVVDMARAMDIYNHELLNLCEQNRLECFDLSSFVPKDIFFYYDDIHFNEKGARIVAHYLADYLLAKPPF